MIVSQAGMLGLTRLSEYARDLEDACRAGAAPQAALIQLRAAAGDIRLYAMPAAGIAAG
jgi:HPt (histidine-containing phosphotransfer) domain-containing protein